MPEASSSPTATPPTASRGWIGLVIGAVVGMAALIAAMKWWEYDKLYPVTEDASLQAHFTWIAPQITGQIVEKYVEPNELVKAGQPLFKIDPRPFQDHLNDALASQVLTNQGVVAQQENIVSLRDLIDKQKALIDSTQQELTRLQPLLSQGFAAQIQGIQVQDSLLGQQAKLASLQAELQQAITEFGDQSVQDARRQQAAAAVALAQLNLEWTVVAAPADGWVTQFNLRVGDVVTAGYPLFPFIESGHWWIDANFKETKLERVEVGQPVTFTVDMYPGQTFHGTVHSLSRGVAASFSLLPPQNTTGNWVKVTQRVPVRILVEETPPYAFRLGASVEAKVDTTVGKKN